MDGSGVDNVHRLIEMFEKRFGKPWADLILFAAGLGIVSWGLSLFMVDIVIPIINIGAKAWKIISGKNVEVPSNLAIILSYVSLFMTLSIFVMWRIYVARMNSFLTRMTGRIEAETEKLRAATRASEAKGSED